MTESSYRMVPWTLAALLASALPHVFRVPIQITLIVAGILIGRLILHSQVRKMPTQSVKLMLALISFIVVFATFHTINGVDAGSALLLCMVAIKTLEMNTLRDHTVLIMASFFIIVSFVLYDTAIWSGLYLLATSALSLFALLKISAPSLKALQLLPDAKLFVWYGLPLAIILFVLFPRIPGPLWGLPNVSSSAKTGLSGSMSPGSISDLVKSNELAFRAKFTEQEPQRRDLYWRGPVLQEFDGKTWKMSPGISIRSSESNHLLPEQDTLNYEVILEPHNKNWLYMLDYPGALPARSELQNDFKVTRSQAITQTTHYTASAIIANSAQADPAQAKSRFGLQRALLLPDDGLKQSRALAQQWRAQYNSDRDIANAALQMFNKEIFSYTLSPQRLNMNDPVDDFLFRSKEGFCEHYASAFVVLMRAAGIPARVVTGYLGGEKNPLSDYYRITQADAHAWAEIYLVDQGWTRIDPTAAIAPERIEQSLQATFPDSNLGGFFGNVGLFLQMESAWYALNTKWFELVLDFNADKQMQLMQKFGFSNPDWRSLIWLLVSGILGVTLFLSLQIWQQSRSLIKDPIQKVYLTFIARLDTLGINTQRGEGPNDLGLRASTHLPEHKKAIAEFIQNYIEARYYAGENQTGRVRELKSLLKQL